MRRLRQARGDNGAAAVEFALLFPIFIIVVLGTITAGTAFSKQLNITQSARETSRYASTLTFTAAGGSVEDWLDNVTAVGMEVGGDPADPLGGLDRLCVAMIDTIVPANTQRKIDGGTMQPGRCFGTAASPDPLGPRYVQVQFERDTSFFAVFVDADLTLRSTSTTPYEPGTAPAPSAAPSPTPSS